uniref:PH01B001E05.12 protein n=1 Tax=Phyllostachys edulis TaxID=38705 RepID=L0P1V5_PHYED|nr:PH01B001E05.12 [Phyllostachys edulis]
MAGIASQWAESEMDAAKMKALVAAEKIPKKEFVNWFEASGQHWPSGEIGQIPVFQVYYLLQTEIDIRVKFICEKALPPIVMVPQILAVLFAEDKM